MEKRYLQVRKSSGNAVLLTFNAHFAVEPSMEEGMEAKAWSRAVRHFI
ncbi:MAG: hypothetical protein ACR5LF_03615 [Symbiopectobacterium sp.]